MPGETGEISVKYNTSKPGRFSKSISIFTNTAKERIVLRIDGNVVDPNKPAPIKKKKSMMSAEK